MPSISGLLSVRVLLAEVVRARREHGLRFVAGVATAGAHEVRGGVVSLRQSLADVGLDVFLAVHAVPAEPSAQLDDRGRAVGSEQLVELDHRMRRWRLQAGRCSPVESRMSRRILGRWMCLVGTAEGLFRLTDAGVAPESPRRRRPRSPVSGRSSSDAEVVSLDQWRHRDDGAVDRAMCRRVSATARSSEPSKRTSSRSTRTARSRAGRVVRPHPDPRHLVHAVGRATGHAVVDGDLRRRAVGQRARRRRLARRDGGYRGPRSSRSTTTPTKCSLLHPGRVCWSQQQSGSGRAPTVDGRSPGPPMDLHATYSRAVAFAGDFVLLTASTGPRTDRGAVYRRPIDGARAVRALPRRVAGLVRLQHRHVPTRGARQPRRDRNQHWRGVPVRGRRIELGTGGQGPPPIRCVALL